MNSYQIKQTVRSRRNVAKKVQRPPLNFKLSKDKALDKRKSSSNDQNQDGVAQQVTELMMTMCL